MSFYRFMGIFLISWITSHFLVIPTKNVHTNAWSRPPPSTEDLLTRHSADLSSVFALLQCCNLRWRQRLAQQTPIAFRQRDQTREWFLSTSSRHVSLILCINSVAHSWRHKLLAILSPSNRRRSFLVNVFATSTRVLSNVSSCYYLRVERGDSFSLFNILVQVG